MTANAVKIRVIYADTDAMGVAYHTNYIRWFEIGRTELLRERGIVYRELESEGFYLPLTELYCHYLKPAKYDDVIRIETSINYFRRASIKFDYEIWDEKRESCLVEGSTTHAFLNRDGKIVRPPQAIADKINTILSSQPKS